MLRNLVVQQKEKRDVYKTGPGLWDKVHCRVDRNQNRHWVATIIYSLVSKLPCDTFKPFPDVPHSFTCAPT